jgi:hypothetical protein
MYEMHPALSFKTGCYRYISFVCLDGITKGNKRWISEHFVECYTRQINWREGPLEFPLPSACWPDTRQRLCHCRLGTSHQLLLPSFQHKVITKKVVADKLCTKPSLPSATLGKVFAERYRGADTRQRALFR